MNRAQLLSDLLRSAVAEQPITVGLSLEYAKEILELIDHLARIESAGGGVEEIRERHENPADPIDIDDALDYMASARRDRGTLLDVVARLHGELDACNETNKKLCADAISDVQQVVRERDAARAQVERLRKSEQYWRKVTCDVCRDTHRMWLSASERHVMCTYCPRPCQLCRSGPFCAQAPCPCKCHKKESGL